MDEEREKFDLHLHSHSSDGALSPKDLVRRCKDLGLEVMALTDHESVKGIPEAVAVGEELGIRVIPGIEFSTTFQGEEHHVLGYFIDYQNEKLKRFIEKWRKTKEEQIRRIIENLQGFGFRITFEEVISLAKDYPSRSHIASTIFSKDENRSLLLRFGIKTHKDFFREFLIDRKRTDDGRIESSRAYVARKRPLIREVIDLIAEIGGVSVWAHMFWRGYPPEKIEERAAIFQKFGLDGIEVCYSFYDQAKTLAAHQIAQKLSMVESAGSDFHRLDGIPSKIGSFNAFGVKINFPFDRLEKIKKEGGNK